jgi:acyl-CoA thioester hydrolase
MDASSVKPQADRLDISIYPHKVDIQLRFADVDLQRHLNNVRIVEIYQEARISFNQALWEPFTLDAASRRLLVARQSVDYLEEVEWPGAVTIGVGVSRTGNTSYSIGLGMFQNDKCVGVSDVVLVYATEKGPTPMPDRIRELVASKALLPKAQPA